MQRAASRAAKRASATGPIAKLSRAVKRVCARAATIEGVPVNVSEALRAVATTLTAAAPPHVTERLASSLDVGQCRGAPAPVGGPAVT